MSFVWPGMLVLLVVVPAAVAGYVALVRRRAARTAELAARGFVPNAAARRLPRARHIPAVLFLVALVALVGAFARPLVRVGLPHREGTVILAFDVSNSMLATDLEPTRMDAAKAAAKVFVEQQPSSIKIGIVAFSNGALITQQPTNVRADTVAAIDRLTPAGATSLGEGIFTSLSAIAGKPLTLPENASPNDVADVDIGYYGSAAIVLLSDGENTSGPDAVAVAQLASTAGVHIYPIGIGSTEGTVLQIDGFSVATALDEQEMTDIATATDGTYYHAQDSATLAQIYRHIQLRSVTDRKETEVTALFAGVGTLLLVVGGVMSMAWFGRLV
ncbi:MAG: von Willebrand factor type [Ilumatobacteraceae bacterium]|nr:von Willebrand factor type [Ilumatobacteraceae bacterium]